MKRDPLDADLYGADVPDKTLYWTIGLVVGLLLLLYPAWVAYEYYYRNNMSPHGFAEMAAVVIAALSTVLIALDRLALRWLGWRRLMVVEAMLLSVLVAYAGYRYYRALYYPFG